VPTARFVVHGRVQGVGFRWFVWRTAEPLGLAGSARNLPDGAVEVVAQGPEPALRALEQALRQGPAQAQVDRVERHDVPHDIPLPKHFHIN
jgi:acylphosphatase